MQDTLTVNYNDFQEDRKSELKDHKFPNYLRAYVVETNDPLNVGRVRFRCPEMHNSDLAVEMCPWAVPAPQVGGPNAGDWANVCIGDIVFICWEKDHPYTPVYVAAANPTRRKFYPIESVHLKTPVYLNIDGAVSNSKSSAPNPPNDYNEDYLPKDNRPMSRGMKDRYGSMIFMGSVGFFPSTHKTNSAIAGIDPVTSKQFSASTLNPKLNNPDQKYLALITKYSNMVILSDIGYDWLKGDTGSEGEFTGDFDKDIEFETTRHKLLQKIVSEDKPTGLDQRRIEFRTRAGHKIELRDTGWNKTRAGEFTPGSRTISQSTLDHRWMKFVTKGGHLIQMIDVGSDPVNDNYYKKPLIEDIGSSHNEEEFGNDARQIRLITRYGFKIVLDDRGSSLTEAESKETPRGNGFLVKGRRSKTTSSGGNTTASSFSSNQRGFGFEFNEKDAINALKLYSPNSQLLEINDKEEFILLCTNLPHDISRPWQGTKENEFSLASGRLKKNDTKTFHLLLDNKNEYLRLKSPKLQGFEVRDKEELVEIRDESDRGLYFSNQKKFGVFRSIEGINAFVMLDDAGNQVLIQNNDGKIQIFASGPIELISDDNITMKANNINFKANTSINFSASGISGKMAGGKFGVDADMHAQNVYAFIPEAEKPAVTAGMGIAKARPIGGATPNISKVKIDREDLSPEADPNERGLAPNTPTSEVNESVIKG